MNSENEPIADPESEADQARKRNVQRRRKAQAKRGSLLKWVLIVLGVLLVLLFIGLFTASTMVKSWLHGDGFRDRLVANLESSLKAEVEVEDLNWQDSSLYIGGVEAQGYRDATIARLDIDGVRASFDGVGDEAWQVPDITINQMSVEFSDDRLPQQAELMLDEGSASASLQSVPRFLRRWVPQKAEIGLVRIDATNLMVKDAEGGSVFSLRAIETASKPITGSRAGWRVQGRGGDMRISGKPEMSVENFDLRWTGSDVFLNHASFGIYEKGRIEADGEVLFGAVNQLDLRLLFSAINCTDVLNETWQKRLSGSFSGEIDVKGELGQGRNLQQSGTIKLTNGILKDLPVLKTISTYTQSPKFNPLFLHEAEIEFVRNGERLVIEDLALESHGLTRLEGTMVLNGEVIESGKFRLGVTPGTLVMIPGAERKVFTQAEGGFLWTDVEVVGTLSQPKENLSQRLVGAAIESVIEDAPGKAIDAVKDVIKDPTGAPGGLIEKGSETLRGFLPFLE